MKKFTLAFSILLISTFLGFSQANLFVEAPLNNNTNGVNRGPNGTSAHASLRGCYLVLQSELNNIPAGTTLTSFGFTMTTGTTGMPAMGNFTVYLQNTTDATYQKGTTYAIALTGMTSVFANVLTIPVSAVTTSVSVTLSSAFVYSGNGLYVAYDWNSTGPFVTTGAVYLGETTALPLPAGGGAFANSATTASATLALTNSRPSFLFGFTNGNTNDVQVLAVEAPGKVNANFNTSHVIRAYVRNLSNITRTNIPVALNVSGANTFANTQTISSLAAGAGILVSFSAFNPSTLGLNTLSASVGSDQNNSNNSAVYAQSVTCNQWAMNPPAGNYTINSVGFNTGAGIFLTPYTNPVASSLAGIRGAISVNAPTAGQQLCGALLSSTGVILATTNTIIVTTGMLGTFQTFTFPSAPALSANTFYYFGVAQINPNAIGYFPAGTLGTYYQPSTLYAFTGIAGGAITVLTNNFGYFGLEAIFGDAPLMLSALPSTVCVGSCATINAPTGTGVTNYTWSVGSAGNSIQACPSSLSNNTYSVIGTTTLGCFATGIISIGINPLPNITIASNNNSVCVGGAITFTANGALSYSVNTVNSQSVITQTPAANTIYTVSGIDANSCENTATFNVTIAMLSVTVSNNTTICKGKSITLSGSGPPNYTYNWAVGNLNLPFSSAAVSPTITSTYTLTTSDGFCSLASLVTVTVSPVPTVTLSSSKPTSCRGEAITISGNSAGNYVWNNNSAITPSITVSPLVNTVYNVTVTNSDGCSGTALLSQNVVLCTAINEAETLTAGFRIFPNPNNGQFTVQNNETDSEKVVEIYNTLGSLVKQLRLSETEIEIDMNNHPNGLYIIKITAYKKMIQVSRIIKQ